MQCGDPLTPERRISSDQESWEGRRLQMAKILTILVVASWAFAVSQVTPQKGDWPVYGHDAAGTRYSPLNQINTANVSRLQRAWTYHTGEKGRSMESTPICVH